MNLRKLSLLLFATITLLTVSVLAVEPFGANVTQISTERVGAYIAQNHSAIAGNVTELAIYGFTTTQSWQGYFGNVTGTIQLADASSNVMYNWSVASPRGQIYSSTNGTGILWPFVQCFNYTAAGTFADDTANRGATSQFGRNLTQLQTMFGINSTGFNGTAGTSRDDDSVDRTFHYRGDPATGHRLFYTNNLEFEAGECQSARIYGPNSRQAKGEFEQALLYEPESESVIFAALINEDLIGFDNRPHDFQMLVLEDGHGTDTVTTTYYFYIELY
jgi:hypothetical protein